MKDPFKTLGVARTASDQEIKGAYRRLAKKYHPDFHENALKAAERFQEIQAAYEELKKKNRRTAKEKPRPADKPQTWTPGPEESQKKDKSSQKSGSIFNFGFWANGDKNRNENEKSAQADGAPEEEQNIDGAEANGKSILKVSFLESINGVDKKLVLPGGKRVNLRVPPGTKDGQHVRLKRKGDAEDIMLKVEVTPHPYMQRRGDDIVLTLPVSLSEAMLGARVRVPTRDGDVVVKIPSGSNTGTILRLKGKGLPKGANGRSQAGDQLLELSVVLPEGRDKELHSFVQKWAANSSYDPRKNFNLTD